MDAPSTFLPRLKSLDQYTAPELHVAIARLVLLYLPEVRGTVAVDEDIEILQADSFERSFAIRWLTGFVSRGSEWAESGPDTNDPEDPSFTASTPARDIISLQTPELDNYFTRTSALDRATALLAACAGTSASGALSRTFTFLTSASSITIALRDESLSVGDHTAVGLQTWGSACVLAERVAKDPPSFGFDAKVESRVLELGAGTGLLSLLAGKISVLGQERGGPRHTVVATDYHPAVMNNLRTNVNNNFSDDSVVEVHHLDWSLYTTGKATTGLSRAPSTSTTPIGTPRIEDKTNSLTPTLGSVHDLLTSAIPTPYTPFSSSLSPPSPRTPQTPKTPQRSRSPPPNLARAVFSRLMARGVKFDMPIEKNVKTGEPETEKIDIGELDGKVCCEPPESEAEFEPSSLPNSPERDVDKQPWIDGLNRASRNASTTMDLGRPHVFSTKSCSLLCGTPSLPCLETHGQTTSPALHLGAKQGCLDASNKLADETASDMTVGTIDAVPAPHALLTPSADAEKEVLFGQVCDNYADRIEVKPTGASWSREDVEVGQKKLGAAQSQIREPDIGAGCKPATERSGNSPIPPPERISAPPFDKPFDIIFGADVVYELSHATLVHDVVQRLLRKPSYDPQLPPAYFHLIMPLRPTHADEATSVDQTFPRVEDVHAQRDGEDEVLAIVRTKTYARSAGIGRADEVQYVYYRMAWV